MVKAKAEPTQPAKPTVSEAFRQDLADFDFNINDALNNGTEWVETTAEVISYKNAKQKIKPGPDDFFIMNGVKVCEVGKSEEIQAKMDAPHDPHGNEGIVVHHKTP